MANQQERTAELHFIAGLATGEGCFFLAVNKVRGRGGKERENASAGYRITPGFRLFMKDHETIHYAADVLRSHGLPVYLYNRKDGMLGLHAMGMKRTKRYVDTLLPFLTGKKKSAAEIVGKFIESREAKPNGSNYDETELELVTELRAVNGNTNGRKNPL